MQEVLLQKYAHLLIRVGLDLRPGQKLILEAPVETFAFARMVAETAYREGAGEVIIHYGDIVEAKIKALNHTPEETAALPDWERDSLSHYLEQGACSLTFTSPKPHLMGDLDEEQAYAVETHNNRRRNLIREKVAEGIQYCIAPVPNPDWAKAVFPGLPEVEAVEKMWELFLKFAYVEEDNDPIEAWKQKTAKRSHLEEILNGFHLDRVRMKSSNGTDIEFGFHPDMVFGFGAGDNVPTYSANIPTEEICTSPDRRRTNGRVVASRPLLAGGKVINHFELTFRDGKVVDCKAEVGEELLKRLIATDEGSAYLGEVAFVPYHSPISQSGLVFHDILIDENASCHLALGRGFAGTVGAHPTDKSGWAEKGLNDSQVHIDFMVGMPDTQITAYTRDGREVVIMKDGDYVIG